MSSNKRLLLKDILVGSIAGSKTFEAINLDESLGFCLVAKATDSAPTDKTFASVNIALSAITINSHGYESGLKVRFSTTGVLPTGLALATDYYLTKASSNIILISSSAANVDVGIYVTLSNGGTGTHTILVQPAGSLQIQMEASLDNETWAYIEDSAMGITSTAKMIEHETAFYHFVRVKFLVTSGQFEVSSKMMVKGGSN